MSKPSLNEFMVKLCARVSADAGVTALLGQRFYNHVPNIQPTMPYAKFWLPTVNDWSTKTEFGQDIELQIDVWDNEMGDKRAMAVAEALRDALNRREFTLTAGQCVTLQLVSMFAMNEGDGLSHHIVSRYQAYVTEVA